MTFFHKNQTLIIVCSLLIVTLAVYWQVTKYDFINFDDDVYVTSNEHVQSGLSFENIHWAFTTTYANFWHPLTWLSFMLDYQLFGLESGMFHFSGILLHLLNSILLFLVFRITTDRVWPSAVVAALFAVHPLHVESVAWISQRKDVLSTLFWILTMWAYFLYTKKQTMGRYLLPICFYVMGLMAKPMLITLPFVLLLFDFWPLGRLTLESSSDKNVFSANRHLIWEKVPYFIITIVFSIITFYAQKSAGATKAFVAYPLYDRMTNALVSYFLYIKKMFLPFGLTLHYPFSSAPPLWQAIIAAVLLIGISLLALLKAKRIPYVTFGWFWFLGTLVPVIGLVQVGLHAMADRYTYISLIGLFVIIAWGVSDISKRWRFQKSILAILTICMIGFMGTISWIQAGYWENSITVFEHAVDVTSSNYVAHNNLANALVSADRSDEAIYHYQEAIRLNPGDAQAINNLGFCLANMGRTEEAIKSFSRALELFPDYSLARYNLGDALLTRGDIDGFVFHYSKALGLKHDSFDAYKALGDILFKKDKVKEAIILYQKALSLDPNSVETHTNLGIAFFREKKLDEAVLHFKKAVSLNPDNPKVIENLKRILAIREKVKQETQSD